MFADGRYSIKRFPAGKMRWNGLQANHEFSRESNRESNRESASRGESAREAECMQARKNSGLVVEQAHARECHGDAILVGSFDNVVVANRSAGLGDVGNARFARAFNVVAEREEGV